jgi:hypothetical protein
MVPALTANGRSFKGAALYYLHDKREAGERERLTGDRVAWTETLNLATEDPERAWRMMATTAMAQAELKKAAGVKATGRKLTTPVLAYSLAWHPDEKVDRAEQLTAAKASLAALGLTEHQAIIVCHNDEPHAHVHVVVNRVHPTEGKAATLSNSKLILSQWAQAYEEARGKILCPARPANNAKRKRGQAVNEPRTPRHLHEAKQASANDSLSAQFVRSDQTQKDAHLKALGRTMQESHRRQWDTLKRTYTEAKAQLYAGGDTRRQRTADAVKEAFKPQWALLFRRQREELKAFEARERSPLGRLRNIAEAIREQGWQAGTARHVLGAVFNSKSGHSRAVFDQSQERERMTLARQVRDSTGGATAAVQKTVRGDLDRLRDDYLTRCDALRTQQAEEREQIRSAWQGRDAERSEAYATLSGRGASKWDDVERTVDQARQQEQGLGRQLQRGPGPE